MTPMIAPPPRHGMMLSWHPPAELQDRLALTIPGAEAASELHVTLLYFGKFNELEDISRLGELRNALSVYVETVAPMKGEISGLGRFTASDQSDGKDPLIALISVPGLHRIRTELEDLCAKYVTPKKSPHGFIAHLTLAYLNSGAPMPITSLPRIPIDIDSLTLKVGGCKEDYELGGV